MTVYEESVEVGSFLIPRNIYFTISVFIQYVANKAGIVKSTKLSGKCLEILLYACEYIELMYTIDS